MPDWLRNKCNAEMAWGSHSNDRNTHNHHSSVGNIHKPDCSARSVTDPRTFGTAEHHPGQWEDNVAETLTPIIIQASKEQGIA